MCIFVCIYIYVYVYRSFQKSRAPDMVNSRIPQRRIPKIGPSDFLKLPYELCSTPMYSPVGFKDNPRKTPYVTPTSSLYRGALTMAHMAISINWGPFFGCPSNKSLTIWGLYQGPLIFGATPLCFVWNEGTSDSDSYKDYVGL